MIRIESLLSARLFIAPQAVGDRIFFMSDLSQRLSLYAIDTAGSVPEPLLPPHIALQNPHLMSGASFVVFPSLDRILVMIDRDGDEVYQPMVIPLAGGFPEPAFTGASSKELLDRPVHCVDFDVEKGIVYLLAESRTEALYTAFRADLAHGSLTKLGESVYGGFPSGANEAHTKVILVDAYCPGDHVVFLKEDGKPAASRLYGTPLSERAAGKEYPPSSIANCHFVDQDRSILFTTSLFSDRYGLGAMELAGPGEVKKVTILGQVHDGAGELEGIGHTAGDRYTVRFNIDGCSWLYEGAFDAGALTMRLDRVLCGRGTFGSGVLESYRYDKARDRHALSFSTATSPTQIYTIEGADRDAVTRRTRERILGVADGWLSRGEDASFTSFDGLRISARLYLPADAAGFRGPRPLVYYVHGGPQSQERPDFAWFSMPLIQFLALQGFAVFVPNVRGSSGYGHSYMGMVERDWGGGDRLDHVHAMTKILPGDARIDLSRAGVVGRSYGGYMSLMLAARHPRLWSAAVDMLGPYDLIGFAERVPETWKPYIALSLGDPVKDRDSLVERSPRTYMRDLACPLLVIQGKNDPRVVEPESRKLVDELTAMGKDVSYLMFEDEGHDILKFPNKVRCYDAVADFFRKHLAP